MGNPTTKVVASGIPIHIGQQLQVEALAAKVDGLKIQVETFQQAVPRETLDLIIEHINLADANAVTNHRVQEMLNALESRMLEAVRSAGPQRPPSPPQAPPDRQLPGGQVRVGA